jgi:hypothetical protein
MKSIFAICLFLILPFSISNAAQDSVAVFHRAEKVVVLINEQNQGRLQAFMDHVGDDTDTLIETPDQSIRLNCGRKYDAASCTFSFLPSTFVKIEDKSLQARATLSELSLPELEHFEMSFESSREDKMTLRIQDGVLEIIASKRVLKTP